MKQVTDLRISKEKETKVSNGNIKVDKNLDKIKKVNFKSGKQEKVEQLFSTLELKS